MAGETLPTGSTNTQGLAPFAEPYITNYLAKAQALSEAPYQVYKGPLTAGESALQTQGFKGLAGLTVPSGIGDAANTAANIAQKAQNLNYSPTAFNNLYNAPAAYQPTTTDFLGGVNRSGLGGTPNTSDPNFAGVGALPPGMEGNMSMAPQQSIAQQYMNPYLQTSLDPQLAEAKRQAMIAQQTNAAKMTQGGAFGGGRSAILDAENQRNLGTKLADITGKGYDTAYKNAMDQFNADQARKMAESQYGYTQGMTSADKAAMYGMDAAKAAEQSKQFGATYANTNLNTALSAAQAQGALSDTQNKANIGNINAQLAGGNTQRGITAEGIAADKAEFEAQRQFPYQQVQFARDMISGLPTGSVTNTAPSMSGIGQFLSSLGGGTAAASALGYKNVGDLLTSLGFDIGQKKTP
jgi:hypothetical protein